jgi:hypothetical protein
VKQTWVNSDPTKPLDQNRLNYMEAGIYTAAATADSANSAFTALTTGGGRLSEESLAVEFAKKPNVILWDGEQYPEPAEAGPNIFVGPEDPGLLMGEGDVWANASATTVSAVVAEVESPSSDLNSAVQAAAVPRVFIPARDLAPIDNRPPSFSNLSASTNNSAGVAAWFFDDASTEVVGTVIATPAGWSGARARLFWSHTVATPSGSVRWLVRCSPFADAADMAAGGTAVAGTSEAPVTRYVKELLIPNVATVDPAGGMLRVSVARVGGDAADTFTGDAALIGVQIERTA